MVDKKSIERQNIICPICREDTFNDMYQCLLKCTGCGFVTAKLPGGSQDFADLYGEEYFTGDEYVDYVGDKKVIQRNMKRWLKIVTEYVSEGVLVEVGSAYGFFLELAQEYFQVCGYDISEDAARYAKEVTGVPVSANDFVSDRSVKNQSANAVVMWDVVEHMEDPGVFVDRASAILNPGGYLFITTGDIEAWLPRHQGPRWRLIHPPTHLQYFSRDTMTRMLGSKGFDVVQVTYPGYWRSVQQILHGIFVLGKHKKHSIPQRLLSWLLPLKTGVYLNTFDIMMVIARKKLL